MRSPVRPIEQRRFAGAVRADQAENVPLPPGSPKRASTDLEAAEGFCHVTGLKEHGLLPQQSWPASA